MNTKKSLKILEVRDSLPDSMKNLISDLVFSKSQDERKSIITNFNTRLELKEFKIKTLQTQTEKAFDEFVEFVQDTENNMEAENILKNIN